MAAEKKKEIYTYEAPWPIFGLNWSFRRNQPFRLAVGSFIEEYANKVSVIQLNEETQKFESNPRFTFDHPYPTTKIMWHPSMDSDGDDLLGTTGDYMRLWKVSDEGISLKCVLNTQSKNSEFCAPLTSFDWHETDPRILGISSIDTTCTIWDVQAEKAKTQLIAHDREVYDIAFSKEVEIFASVGADGSVRMFDMRSMEHSTIIYESPDNQPLLRLAWNKQDPHYLATFAMDSPKVVILDIRVPSIPVAELTGHSASINGLAWAPHSSCHICTAGDDAQALIWDLQSMPRPIQDPILAYNAEAEVNQLQWSALQVDWVAIAFGSKVQMLRV